jgi:hypothetical protein
MAAIVTNAGSRGDDASSAFRIRDSMPTIGGEERQEEQKRHQPEKSLGKRRTSRSVYKEMSNTRAGGLLLANTHAGSFVPMGRAKWPKHPPGRGRRSRRTPEAPPLLPARDSRLLRGGRPSAVFAVEGGFVAGTGLRSARAATQKGNRRNSCPGRSPADLAMESDFEDDPRR